MKARFPHSGLKVEDVVIKPLTPERWSYFRDLFGDKGAYGGCWCMWWRLSRREFEKGQGAGNRRAMKRIVDSGVIPGLLAFKDGKAVGWCSVAPRENYGVLERSRVLKRLDDKPVWSIVCFYVHKDYHNQGISGKLILGAIQYVKACGGRIIESYPTQPRTKKLPPVSSFMGLPGIFKAAGFVECKRASASKIIMRYYLD
jgi:GNAT superfamily N-acetyltransferase